MMKLLNRLFDFVAHIKVYFANAGLYLSIANFIMILATFKLTYKLDISAYAIIPIGFLAVLLVGYIDYRVIHLRQTEHMHKKNALKYQLNRIEKKLEDLEKKLE